VAHIDDHFPCIKHEINPPHKIGYIFHVHYNLHTNTASVAAIQEYGTAQIKKKGKHFSDVLPFCVTFPFHIYIYKTITHNMLTNSTIVK
jgi:hypothetical protein